MHERVGQASSRLAQACSLPRLRGRAREGACGLATGMTRPNPRKPRWRVSTRMRANARALRTDMTRAERIIWRAVRAHRLNGAGFRRQTPIGPFIVDFVSHAAMLIIEIDGGQHFEDVHEARDAARDAYLRGKGYRVLRFNNHEVMTNREGVLTTIASVLGEAAAPSLPSPGISAFTRVFDALCGGGGEAAACVADKAEPGPRNSLSPGSRSISTARPRSPPSSTSSP